jgi:hypothetical protein
LPTPARFSRDYLPPVLQEMSEMQKINLFDDKKIIKNRGRSSPDFSGKKQESGIKW